MRLPSARIAWLIVAGAALAVAGCNQNTPPGPTPLPNTGPAATSASGAPATAVPQATQTSEPLAARVDGQPITMAQYQAEVARYEAGVASLNRNLADQGNYHKQVLDTLIDQALIEEAAQAQHVSVSDAEVENQYQASIKDAQGQDKFDAWLKANQWTPDQYRQVLRSELLTQKMVDQVTANLPTTAEQVHARHILVSSEAEAQDVLNRLKAGADFAQLAAQVSIDPATKDQGGDLGWFPKGLLVTPELEQAAFSLQPGQTSGVVKSSLGYHIVQVLERDPKHPLSQDSLARLHQAAFESWLAGLRAKAQIERFAPGT